MVGMVSSSILSSSLNIWVFLHVRVDVVNIIVFVITRKKTRTRCVLSRHRVVIIASLLTIYTPRNCILQGVFVYELIAYFDVVASRGVWITAYHATRSPLTTLSQDL